MCIFVINIFHKFKNNNIQIILRNAMKGNRSQARSFKLQAYLSIFVYFCIRPPAEIQNTRSLYFLFTLHPQSYSTIYLFGFSRFLHIIHYFHHDKIQNLQRVFHSATCLFTTSIYWAFKGRSGSHFKIWYSLFFTISIKLLSIIHFYFLMRHLCS